METRHYLSNKDFNIAMVLEYMRGLILAQGGRIVSSVKKEGEIYLLSNRDCNNRNIVRTHHESYISFVLNGMFYYFQVDDFSHDPQEYQKGKMLQDNTCFEPYIAGIENTWITDEFSEKPLKREQIQEAAETLLQTLVSAKETGTAMKRKEISVPNTYNKSRHREVILVPRLTNKLFILA